MRMVEYNQKLKYANIFTLIGVGVKIATAITPKTFSMLAKDV
jgi:hypothetical protein